MESDAGGRLPDWDVDWGTQDPLATPNREPDPDSASWGIEAEAPLAWRFGSEAGAGGAWPAGPPAQDAASIYGDLEGRSRRDPDAPWNAAPAAGSEQAAGAAAWPFEDTSQSWEPSDRSWIWPAEELPPVTGNWEPPPWRDEPAWTPPPAPEPWEVPGPSWTAAGPLADEPAAPAWSADPEPLRPVEQDPMVPFHPAEQEPPLRPADWDPMGGAWSPAPAPGYGTGGAGATEAPGWDDQGGTRMEDPGGPQERVDAGRGRRERQTEERRRSWPRVVAILSWIVLLMVVCWFYVFPWLERVLPSNF
jgi:hypothetical protein